MRFVVFVIGLLGLILLLKWQFPYAAQSSDEYLHIIYSVALLILVSGGFLYSNQYSGSYILKTAMIWLGIMLLLVLGYSYRDAFMNNRLVAELMPHRARVSEDGSIQVRSDETGHFFITMQVNGAPVKFLVDTGASNIVLSPRDAARVGFEPQTLNYNRIFHTANGMGRGATVRLNSLSVDGILLRNVEASVNEAGMEESLLGMDFLKSLRSYKVEGNTLTLVP